MIKELTIEQRHEIYKEAKEIFMEGWLHGMCYPIRLALKTTNTMSIYNCDMDDLLHLLPEFEKIKPSEFNCGVFWWDIKNRQIRLDNFNKLIKQTEQRFRKYNKKINNEK